MTMRSLLLSTVAATGTLALGYALDGLWREALPILTFGLLWLLGQWRGWGRLASVAFVFLLGAAAVGIWLDLGRGWMLLGAVAALSAWDLDHFAQRQKSVGRVENVPELERRHLQRLLVVNSLGFLLATVGLGIEIKVSFGAALFLALLAVLGLSRAIGFLRRENSDRA